MAPTQAVPSRAMRSDGSVSAPLKTGLERVLTTKPGPAEAPPPPSRTEASTTRARRPAAPRRAPVLRSIAPSSPSPGAHPRGDPERSETVINAQPKTPGRLRGRGGPGARIVSRSKRDLRGCLLHSAPKRLRRSAQVQARLSVLSHV